MAESKVMKVQNQFSALSNLNNNTLQLIDREYAKNKGSLE